MRSRLVIQSIFVLIALSCTAILADDFTLSWWTADGGGASRSTGGSFELRGTIGQADANQLALTGGGFELTGGFWATPSCWCVADINGDGHRDGRDVQRFLDCLLGHGGDCSCADINVDGVLDLSDITAFVNDLLAG